MNGKIVDGVELLRMIRDGEIKEGTEIKDSNGNKYIFKTPDKDIRWSIIQKIDKENRLYEAPRYFEFVNKDTTFEFVEEDEEIDIDSIEELLKIQEYEVDKTDTVINRNKINELVKAVKQLNKRMQPKITKVEQEILDKHIPRID